MTMRDESFSDGLLSEVAKEEVALAEADAQLKEARARFNVASRKYAAVRDMVTRELDQSPYVKESRLALVGAKVGLSPLTLGRYRFIHMRVGDGVVQALKEIQEPATLEQIVDRLNGGRLATTDITRAVNAALMRTSGVEKTEDGKYTYKAEELEPEDLPF